MYPAGIAAELVIGEFLRKAREDLPEWTAKYQEDIERYLNNPQKIELAKQKLATWYEILNSEKANIRQVYNQMRTRYEQELAKLIVPKSEVPVTRRAEKAEAAYAAATGF